MVWYICKIMKTIYWFYNNKYKYYTLLFSHLTNLTNTWITTVYRHGASGSSTVRSRKIGIYKICIIQFTVSTTRPLNCENRILFSLYKMIFYYYNDIYNHFYEIMYFDICLKGIFYTFIHIQIYTHI